MIIIKSPYYSLENVERILKVERVKLRTVADRAGAYYMPYDTEQIKSNGSIKIRHIDNPNKKLKIIQKKILQRILLPKMLSLPNGITGGVSGKSIKDNAYPHIDQEMVVIIDIKNCFPKTNEYMVFKVWRNVMGCGTRTARLLTQLTTFRTILPQGAPTSNALCNLNLLPLFNELKVYTDKNNIALSLYVDDITISGKITSVLPAISFVISKVQKYGFSVRREKIGIMPANKQQKVTGLIVNKEVSIARVKIDDVRNKIISIAKRRTGITKTEYDSIMGNIQFVNSISEEKAEKLKHFAEIFLPKDFISSEGKGNFVTKKCRHHKNDN